MSAASGLAAQRRDSAALQRYLEDALAGLEGIVIHGRTAPRVGNTTLFSLPGASAQTLLMALDLDKIAVSSGAACASGTVRPGHVLTAMGAGEDAAGSALRVSTGWQSGKNDIDRFLEVWQNIYRRLRDNRRAEHRARA